MDEDRIIAAIAALGGKFDRLDGRMDRMEGRMDGFDGKLDRLRGDVFGKLESIQNQLTAIRDDIGVNMGAANTAMERNENTRKEVHTLTEMVMTMHRQMMRMRTDVDELKARGAGA